MSEGKPVSMGGNHEGKPDHRVLLTCANGHEQSILVCADAMTLDEVKAWVGLLDGTSSLFVFKPGPESLIGKCNICGSQISGTVTPGDELLKNEGAS